jgi:hypothetical protein
MNFGLPMSGSNHAQEKCIHVCPDFLGRFGFLNGIIYNGCEKIPGFTEEHLIQRHQQPPDFGATDGPLGIIFLLSPGVERGAFAAR